MAGAWAAVGRSASLGVAVVDPGVRALNLLNFLGGVILSNVEAIADVVRGLALLDFISDLLALGKKTVEITSRGCINAFHIDNKKIKVP